MSLEMLILLCNHLKNVYIKKKKKLIIIIIVGNQLSRSKYYILEYTLKKIFKYISQLIFRCYNNIFFVKSCTINDFR